MEETSSVTRGEDVQRIAVLYAQGVAESPDTFRSIDRVSVEWPWDGNIEQRTMFISSTWIAQYHTGEITGRELVLLIGATESRYEESSHPMPDAVCYPDTAVGETTTAEPTSEDESQIEVPAWTTVSGNESELQNANLATPTGIVAKLVEKGVPVTKYRVVRNDTFGDTLQIEFDWVNESRRKQYARTTALVVANATDQGYNDTGRVFMWWPRKSGIVDHMYVKSLWVDKYLTGTWSKQEYIYRVFTTEGDS